MELITDLSQLEVGDEIITIKGSSALVRLKLLTKPMPSKTRKNWYTKQPLFKAVKATTRIETKTVNYGHGTWTKQVHKYATSEDHNSEIRIDLNYKDVLLVKKASNEN